MKIDESAFYKQLGQRLKAHRLESSRKQEDVAKSVGIERTTLTHIEAGRQKPALHTFFLLCLELHVTPEQILPKWSEALVDDTENKTDSEIEDVEIVGEKSAITPKLSAFLTRHA